MQRGGFRVSPAYQGQEGIFEESARRGRRQPGGFCNCKQVIVFVKEFVSPGNIWFLPGRTPPDQPHARFENDAGMGLHAVQQDFAFIQPAFPLLFRRMVIPGCKKGRYGKAGISTVYLNPVFESTVKRQS
jgi:hypothetical protein